MKPLLSLDCFWLFFVKTVIYGRSMRIKMCGDTCVQITDRASGITVVGTGSSAQVKIKHA